MADRARGIDFELSAADIFSLLGYHVERDALIAGSQVDLVLRRTTGVIRELYLVECKDHKELVGIVAVRSFWATLAAARREFPVANGIFLSRVGLTKEAKAFADQVGIQNLTLLELESQLVDLAPYARVLVEQFEKAEWAQHYIDIEGYLIRSASILDDTSKHWGKSSKTGLGLVGNDAADIGKMSSRRGCKTGLESLFREIDLALSVVREKYEERETISPHLGKFRRLLDRLDRSRSRLYETPGEDQLPRINIRKYVEDWLGRQGHPGLILLGDYGTGKTTFLQRLAALQSRKFIAAPDRFRCPILLFLKDFPGGIDDRVLLAAIGEAIGDPTLNRNLLEGLIRRGKFIFLLDGFDEMGLQVDARTRRTVFMSLLRIMQRPGGKVIVSGRHGYFPSRQELETFLDLIEEALGHVRELEVEAISVAAFSERQIKSYLESFDWKSSHLTVGSVTEVINHVYNLRELAERPFLLDLIVKTIPLLEGSEGQEISPARLYEIYTDRWLSREYAKGEFRWLIQRTEKKAFMVELAWRMLVSGSLKLHFSELADWVRSYFSVTNPETVDYLAQDIRTCSFLGRDDDGYYSFMHRSFMEYFVALRMVEEVEQGQSIATLVSELSADSLTGNSVAFALDLIWRRLGAVEEVLELMIPLEFSFVRTVDALRLIRSLPLAIVKICADEIIGSEKMRHATRASSDWLSGSSVLGSRYWNLLGENEKEEKASRVRESGKNEDERNFICSFCGRTKDLVSYLIKGPEQCICSDCSYEGFFRSILLKMDERSKSSDLQCTFCQSRHEPIFVSACSGQRICAECVDVCMDALIEDEQKTANAAKG